MIEKLKEFITFYKFYLFERDLYNRKYICSNTTSCTVPSYNSPRKIWKITMFYSNTSTQEHLWVESEQYLKQCLEDISKLNCIYEVKEFDIQL